MADRQTKVTLSATATQYISEFEKAAKKTRELGSAAEKLGKQREAFERLGRGAVLTGAAITAATLLSVKAAIDWESAWAGVTKTVDGSTSEMAVLEDQLRGLAKTLPATHQEIAAVAEAAGQLGVAREDVAAFTKTMIDLGETTNLTADEAATSIAQLMNVMQTAPEEVDNLGAALVALGNDGASTERDIVQMAQRIAGAGKIVGLSEAQVLGFANALASVGIEAEAGGTAISRIMTDIAMSVSAGGDDLDKFAQVAGVSAAEFSTAFKTAPAEAIATFVEGLGRINAEGGDVFKTLSDLGQSDIRVSQALLGMANSGDLLRESLELGSAAWEDNLALIEEARKRYETTEARLQIMKNSIEDAAIGLGDVFLPAVKAGADGVSGLAQAFTDMPEPVQGLVGLLGGIGGAVALTGGLALLAVPKIAEFRVALQTLGTTAGRLAFVGGGVTVALTAVVAAVGTLAAQHAEARQRAESYADALARGADAIRDVAVENLAAEQSWAWMSKGSAFDAAERLGASLTTLTEAAQGNSAAMQELSVYLKAADGDEQALNEVMEQSGLTRLEAVDSLNTMVTTLREQSSALEDGKRIEEQRNEVTEDGVGVTNAAADAYLDAANNVDDLNSKLSALVDQVNEANGVGQDAITANIAYRDALAKVDETIKSGEGTRDDHLGLLVDLAQKSQDAAKKQLDLDGDTGAYIETLKKGRQDLLDRAADLGLNADEAKNLADQIYAIPDEKEVKIIADTAKAATAIRQFVLDASAQQIRIGVTTYSKGTDGLEVKTGNTLARAGGGRINGPGTRTSDSIPLWASNDEHMLSAAEVDGLGGHAGVERIRHWARTGQGFPFPGAGGGGSTQSGPYVVIEKLYARDDAAVAGAIETERRRAMTVAGV